MKKLKITFDPAFFENFDGTQEELDSLINEIEEKFANGDFSEDLIMLDEITESMTDEEIDDLVESVSMKKPPTLH